MVAGRDHLAVAVLRGRLYAIGGRREGDFGLNLNANEEYDPKTDTWRRRAPLPTTRSGIAAAVVGGRIFVFGGESTSGTFRENEAYDPAKDTWAPYAPMLTARHGLAAVAVGDRIFVISGGPVPGGSDSDKNEVFSP
jgi:N-acetylneuraminic acid mutarotase